MQFFENITKFMHKTFGIGVYKGKINDSTIIVEFSSGTKKISTKVFSLGLMSEVGKPMSGDNTIDNATTEVKVSQKTIQYDSSKVHIGEKNILEASVSNNNLLFNESYTIIGKEMKAASIHACYHLTVIGDLCVDKIEVKGSLSVIGDIKAQEIICQNDLICSGAINCSNIEVGGDLFSETLKCKNLYCGKNTIIKTTVDIEETRIEKVLVAGEGIVGEGNLVVQNAVAVEYFEYDGNVKGKVFELDTDSSFGTELETVETTQELTFDNIIKKFPEIISKEITKRGEFGEDDILEFASEINEQKVAQASEWFDVFSYVIDISYLDEITNFRDYLFLLYAKEILPTEMLNYESVEHIFKKPFEEAIAKSEDMLFSAKNITEFIMALRVISIYGNKLTIDKEEAFDKVFQSVGLKYSTVKKYLVK